MTNQNNGTPLFGKIERRKWSLQRFVLLSAIWIVVIGLAGYFLSGLLLAEAPCQLHNTLVGAALGCLLALVETTWKFPVIPGNFLPILALTCLVLFACH